MRRIMIKFHRNINGAKRSTTIDIKVYVNYELGESGNFGQQVRNIFLFLCLKL